MGKLNAKKVENAKPGRHIDGRGLYLLVKPSGSKSWVVRVQKDGKRRDFGIGSAADVSLADARTKADELRREVRSGVDPVVKKRQAKAVPTFKAAALACHKALKRGWTEKHAEQWLTSLEDHAFKRLGDVRVDQVDAPMIRDMLFPIWHDIPNTARRVKQRVGVVLDYAFAEKWRSAESPTRAVTKILAPHTDKPKHYKALPYVEVPELMAKLREGPDSIGRYALMFTILTAARSGEVRSMVWSEVGLDAAVWTVPAHKMKMRAEHMVPLSPPAVAILRAMAGLLPGGADEPVFPGRGTKPLSDMTIIRALRDAGCNVTVHGFRSSFRDWAAEEANFNDDVIEASLAHTNPSATTRAYKRTTFFEKRRKLMEAWASYLNGQTNVIALAEKRA